MSMPLPQKNQPDPQTDTSWYTLEPLRTDGPDALLVQGTPGIRKITLTEIEIDWQNDIQEVTIHRASDLFECAEATPPPYEAISAKGKLASATFELQLENSESPHKVSIRPPRTVTLEFSSDKPQILHWLRHSPFRVARPCPSALAASP